MRMRADLIREVKELRVKHYLGPPPELSGGHDARVPMASAAYLVIDETGDGVFLHRFSKENVEVGDTWHKTVEDAKEQAHFEYGDALGSWEPFADDL